MCVFLQKGAKLNTDWFKTHPGCVHPWRISVSYFPLKFRSVSEIISRMRGICWDAHRRHPPSCPAPPSRVAAGLTSLTAPCGPTGSPCSLGLLCCVQAQSSTTLSLLICVALMIAGEKLITYSDSGFHESMCQAWHEVVRIWFHGVSKWNKVRFNALILLFGDQLSRHPRETYDF